MAKLYLVHHNLVSSTIRDIIFILLFILQHMNNLQYALPQLQEYHSFAMRFLSSSNCHCNHLGWVWVVRNHHASPQHVEIISYLDDGFLRIHKNPTTKTCLSHYVAPCSYQYAWRKQVSEALSWTKGREEMSIDRFLKAMNVWL
jgi:hypothetical protein